MSNHFLNKYTQRLPEIAAPGDGCHPALLGIANLGIMGGLTPEHIFVDLKRAIKPGKRRVPDQEIWAAIKRAFLDHGGSANALPPSMAYREFIQQKKEPLLNDGKAVLRNIIGQSIISDEADIIENSPIRINWPPNEDPINLLSTLYKPQDLLFTGGFREPGILGKTIKCAADWSGTFKVGGTVGPHIIPNPLNGIPVEKKAEDGLTLRGDGNIIRFRFCIAEFDNLTREEQLRFWSAVKLPICALIDTAGKSIHAWIDCRKLGEINSEDQWDMVIRGKVYEECLIPMGVDKACHNPSRLSRLPGHLRSGGKYQRLLWLSPEGREVVA